ncbi:MAG: HAD-IIB family hydrolase [Mollicutes bacterium]|nr:HAD-IIB family hydrolase [Mollicutes bacterium]
MKNELYYNFKKSLEQKYNAVCFDINGTLTEEKSKKIDNRAIKLIIELLKRKVPVVFITGRGETGLNDFKNDIYDFIANSIGITDNDIKRIHVLTNDGARLFYSNGASYEEFLSQDTYITTKDELNQLMKINATIKNINSNYFDITYSKDLKTNTIINIRLVFKIKNANIIKEVNDALEKIISANKLAGIYLTRGIYKDNTIIQIGTTTKDKAIERVEKIIGVPKNSMMRVGDCGDIHGNDYLMLNCQQGYSVDKTSGSVDSCFPIFDENGNILKGVVATIELINNSKILPTVCLEKADILSYKLNFAIAEKKIVLGRKKLLKKYNEIINKNFETDDGIDGLFDKSSGSILIPMYEWELISNNSLKEFWNSQADGNLIYLLRDDNNYLLRGSSTYYYFLANRISLNGRDITTKNNVLEWHRNYIRFLNDAEQAILNTKEINSLINKKLLLGILDNCRNVLLVIMNHKLVSNNVNDNILLDISSKENKDFNDIYNILFEIEDIMSKICFEEKVLINKDLVCNLVRKSKELINDNFMIEQLSNEKKDYSKDYRAYREIDNFGENYTAVSLYKEKRGNTNDYINACGLSYGGIELPIIAKIVDKNTIESLLLLKFNKEVSGYSNKQLIDLRKFNINEYGGLINSNVFRHSNVDLFDDNVLTGKTLQLAINSLYDSDIDVNNICIVRYPGINRIDQMFLDNIAAVDFHLFFDYIYGLCYSSPYSWKDNEWKNKDGKIDYKDSIGVFDINRKKIIECLIKNHDYNDNSEVGEYKRRLLK